MGSVLASVLTRTTARPMDGPQPDRAGAISVSGSPFRAGSLPPQLDPHTDSVRLVSFRFTSTYSRIFRPRTRPLSRPLVLITPNTTPNTPVHSSLTVSQLTARLLRSNPPRGDVSLVTRCRRQRKQHPWQPAPGTPESHPHPADTATLMGRKE